MIKSLGVAKTVLLALAALVALLLVGGANAQIPQYPTTISGIVTVDGNPALGGRSILALIEGSVCDSAVTASDGSYRLSIGGRAGIHLVCDKVGATITFLVDNRPVPETAVREPAALVTLNLTVTTATRSPAVSLVQGLNAVQYRGGGLPVEQALSNCLTAVNAVFVFDSAAQAWTWWFKGASPGVNTLLTLNSGAILWVVASAACDWMQT